MQSDLGVSFLLQIGDNALSHKFGISDHVQNFVVFSVNQSQFESVFGSVDVHGARLAFSVEHENLIVAFHFGQVNWHVQGTDDSVVAVGDGVLDMIRSGVHKNALVVPSSGFHSRVFLDGAQSLEFLVANIDAVLGQKGNSGHVWRPDDVSALGDLDMAEVLALLNVKKGDTIRITEQKHSGSSIENFVAIWSLDFLSHLVLQILDHNLEKKIRSNQVTLKQV